MFSPLNCQCSKKVRGQLRSELLDNLTSKALRFASPSSNQSLREMIADNAFVVNPDYLVANAVSSESNPARISDNLVILNQARRQCDARCCDT